MRTQEKTDLDVLFKISGYARELIKKNHLNYNFKIDCGSYETRVDIHLDGHWVRGNGHLPLIGYEMFCPDLVDFIYKKIIEYEELAKPNTGFFHAKKHKGHTDYTNTRDSIRDLYYRTAKFDLCKIFENEFEDGSWKEKLEKFLLKPNPSLPYP